MSGIIEVIVYVFFFVICLWFKVLGLSWFVGIIDVLLKEFILFVFDFCVGFGESKSFFLKLMMLFLFGCDVIGVIFCLLV